MAKFTEALHPRDSTGRFRGGTGRSSRRATVHRRLGVTVKKTTLGIQVSTPVGLNASGHVTTNGFALHVNRRARSTTKRSSVRRAR